MVRGEKGRHRGLGSASDIAYPQAKTEYDK